MINPFLRVGFAVASLGLVGGSYGLVSQYKGNSESQSLIPSSLRESDQGNSSLNPSGDRGQVSSEEVSTIHPDSHISVEGEGLQDMEGEISGRATEDPSLNVLIPDLEQKGLSEEKLEETGKCKVLATEANILSSVVSNSQDYYTIFCDNEDSPESSLPPRWTALFPKSIFKEGIQFKVDQQLNIGLQTDMGVDVPDDEESLIVEDLQDVEQWYEMKVTSNKFKTETITGFWGYKKFADESSGIIIVLNDSNLEQEIYLMLGQEDEE